MPSCIIVSSAVVKAGYGLPERRCGPKRGLRSRLGDTEEALSCARVFAYLASDLMRLHLTGISIGMEEATGVQC